MNQSITKLAIALCMATSTLFSLGVKADNDSDYRKYADETRKAVYAMPMPEFENPQIPKELKTESAVIMARYQDIVMGKQLGFGMNFFLTGNGLSYVRAEAGSPYWICPKCKTVHMHHANGYCSKASATGCRSIVHAGC